MRALKMVVSFGAGYMVGAKTGDRPIRWIAEAIQERFAVGNLGRDDRCVVDVMTALPITVPLDASVARAAQAMAEHDIGDVIVIDPDTEAVAGIITDRDIILRGIAEGLEPEATTVDSIFSRDIVAVGPETALRQALDLMKDLNVRRLPVVDGDRAVGVVTLGDLSVATDTGAALAEISSAVPDR